MTRSKRKRSNRVSSGGSTRGSHGLGPLQEVRYIVKTNAKKGGLPAFYCPSASPGVILSLSKFGHDADVCIRSAKTLIVVFISRVRVWRTEVCLSPFELARLQYFEISFSRPERPVFVLLYVLKRAVHKTSLSCFCFKRSTHPILTRLKINGRLLLRHSIP